MTHNSDQVIRMIADGREATHIPSSGWHDAKGDVPFLMGDVAVYGRTCKCHDLYTIVVSGPLMGEIMRHKTPTEPAKLSDADRIKNMEQRIDKLEAMLRMLRGAG